MTFFNLFSAVPTVNELLLHSYDLDVVILSIVIAVIGCVLTLFMLDASRELINSKFHVLIQILAALTLGTSVWSMHFTGMLSFHLNTHVTYSAFLTILSMFPAVLAGWVATQWLELPSQRLIHIIGAGVIIGAGIGLMHYMGMFAMQMNASLRFDTTKFLLAVFTAVILSILALLLRGWLMNRAERWLKWLVSGTVLGLAISAMHYIGMWSAYFIGSAQSDVPLAIINREYHLTIVILSSVCLMVIAMLGHFYVRAIYNITLARLNELKATEILEQSNSAIIVLDHHLNITRVNSECEQILAMHRDNLEHKQISDIFPDWNRISTRNEFYTESGADITLKTVTGKIVHVKLKMARIMADTLAVYVGFLMNIQTYKEKEQSLVNISHRDQLTGLFNRLFLEKQLDQEMESANLIGNPLSLVILDIDHFKSINDTYGHLNGDHVLINLAKTIQQVIRKYDFAVRFGGEEFLLILPNTNGDEAMVVAEKLRQEIATSLIALDDGQSLNITASLGVTCYCQNETAREMLHRADSALYQAKEQGRNRSVQL